MARAITACRSAIPVITALLAIVIERQVPTKAETVGLVVLTSGVMLSVYEGSGGTSRGILICMAGQSALAKPSHAHTRACIASHSVRLGRDACLGPGLPPLTRLHQTAFMEYVAGNFFM